MVQGTDLETNTLIPKALLESQTGNNFRVPNWWMSQWNLKYIIRHIACKIVKQYLINKPMQNNIIECFKNDEKVQIVSSIR